MDLADSIINNLNQGFNPEQLQTNSLAVFLIFLGLILFNALNVEWGNFMYWAGYLVLAYSIANFKLNQQTFFVYLAALIIIFGSYTIQKNYQYIEEENGINQKQFDKYRFGLLIYLLGWIAIIFYLAITNPSKAMLFTVTALVTLIGQALNKYLILTLNWHPFFPVGIVLFVMGWILNIFVLAKT